MIESIKFNELAFFDFLKLATHSVNPALICGNGLSINFEPNLSISSLGENLYNTHMKVMTCVNYKIFGSKKMEAVYKPNYLATYKYLKRTIHNSDEFTAIFNDGINFAKSILKINVVSWLQKSGFDIKLSMGIGPLDSLALLVSQAENSGVFGVNYEYWSLIVYFVLAIKEAPSEIYTLDPSNRFVLAVLAGSSHTMGFADKYGVAYYSKACENGMFIYLRFLLSSNILLAEKGIQVSKLTKWGRYNIKKINEFFSLFDCLITTNYDSIIEEVSSRQVKHLHGRFQKEQQIALFQSLGIYLDAIRIDLTSILIGDYYISKIFYGITAGMAVKQPVNSKIESYNQILEQAIQKNRTNFIVIFGLNVDNDFHIVRDLQIFLEASGTEAASIVFCYYSLKDKDAFIRTYSNCVTYSTQLDEFVKNQISVYTINSKTILQNYFIPNE